MPNKDVGKLCFQKFIVISADVTLVTNLVRLTVRSNTMTGKTLFLELEQSEILVTDCQMLPTRVNSQWMAPLNRHNKWQLFLESRNAQRNQRAICVTWSYKAAVLLRMPVETLHAVYFCICHYNKYMNHDSCNYEHTFVYHEGAIL